MIERKNAPGFFSAPLFVFGALLFFSSCTQRKSDQLVPKDHAAWKKTTGIELNYPIPGHENTYRKIFINPIGEGVKIIAAQDKNTYEYPEGTIILKEIYEGQRYEPGMKPVMLTAMIKSSSAPEARGGWIWVVKDTASGKETVFTDEFCVTCHSNANEAHPYGDGNKKQEFRDYVFFPYTPR